MKMYIPGLESEERFNHILSLTNIRSKDIIEALHSHIVNGHDEEVSALLIDLSNFKRALRKFNHTLTIIEKIKEHDWGKKCGACTCS